MCMCLEKRCVSIYVPVARTILPCELINWAVDRRQLWTFPRLVIWLSTSFSNLFRPKFRCLNFAVFHCFFTRMMIINMLEKTLSLKKYCLTSICAIFATVNYSVFLKIHLYNHLFSHESLNDFRYLYCKKKFYVSWSPCKWIKCDKSRFKKLQLLLLYNLSKNDGMCRVII